MRLLLIDDAFSMGLSLVFERVTCQSSTEERMICFLINTTNSYLFFSSGNFSFVPSDVINRGEDDEEKQSLTSSLTSFPIICFLNKPFHYFLSALQSNTHVRTESLSDRFSSLLARHSFLSFFLIFKSHRLVNCFFSVEINLLLVIVNNEPVSFAS
jgi:hypothetical protein